MEFFIPQSFNELAEALDKKEENTFLCAGGTDLMIHLRNQACYNYSIIDLTHLSDIRQIEDKDDKIVIGAGVTMTMLENNDIVKENIGALAKAASMVGSTQIRNLATIGGNIANASQSADTIPVLFAYSAKAVILNEKGNIDSRPLEEVIIGTGQNTLGKKEAILYIELEKSKDYSNFLKVGSRKTVTISKVNACIKVKIDDGLIQKAVVYLGAVGRKALPAAIIEKALEGQKVSQLDEELLKYAVNEQIETNIPNRESKHYKKSATFGIIMNFIEDMQEKQRGK
jgi:CO/xanthine dehydrogenase FAD-binding subunit